METPGGHPKRKSGLRGRWLLAGLSALVAVSCGSSPKTPSIEVRGPISLLELFPQAEKRAMASQIKVDDLIKIVSVALPAGTDAAIFQHPPTRLIYHLKLIQPVRLETAVALLPEAWNQKGDGVLFYIAVDTGTGQPEYLFQQQIGPEQMLDMQEWQTVSVDLTAYRNQQVQLIFGTDPGRNADYANDLAVWKEPRIVRAPGG
jgi:hypothetical protein